MELQRAEKEIKGHRLLHGVNRLRQISRLLHFSSPLPEDPLS